MLSQFEYTKNRFAPELLATPKTMMNIVFSAISKGNVMEMIKVYEKKSSEEIKTTSQITYAVSKRKVSHLVKIHEETAKTKSSEHKNTDKTPISKPKSVHKNANGHSAPILTSSNMNPLVQKYYFENLMAPVMSELKTVLSQRNAKAAKLESNKDALLVDEKISESFESNDYDFTTVEPAQISMEEQFESTLALENLPISIETTSLECQEISNDVEPSTALTDFKVEIKDSLSMAHSLEESIVLFVIDLLLFLKYILEDFDVFLLAISFLTMLL